MTQLASPEIRKAVSDAVALVNSNKGQTCVRLRFLDDAVFEEIVANAASLNGENFTFSAGFDTYGGTVDDLAAIEAEVIADKSRGPAS